MHINYFVSTTLSIVKALMKWHMMLFHYSISRCELSVLGHLTFPCNHPPRPPPPTHTLFVEDNSELKIAKLYTVLQDVQLKWWRKPKTQFCLPQLPEVSPKIKLKEKEANLGGGGFNNIEKVTSASTLIIPIPRISFAVWNISLMSISHLQLSWRLVLSQLVQKKYKPR